MTQITPAPSRPTARCKSFAALLPVLDISGGDAKVEDARAHLADCAYCQAQYAAYRQIDATLFRHLSPPAIPRYRTEDIVRDALAWPEMAEETEPTPATTMIGPLTPPGRTVAQRPASRRRFAGGLAALAAAVILALLAFQAYRVGLLGNGAPNAANFSTSNLEKISMVSPTEGWAVGETTSFSEAIGKSSGKPETAQVLLWHYLHGRWAAVNLPIAGVLDEISMDSPTDGWATGYTPGVGNGKQTSLLLHYNGHTWQQMPLSPQMKSLGQVVMLSATDGWMIGGQFFWHYDGHTWTPQTVILPGGSVVTLTSLSMLSPTDGWALGARVDTSDSGFLLHYTGGKWSVQQMFTGIGWGPLTMGSDTEGWMPGQTEPYNNDPNSEVPQLIHYTNGQFKDATSSFRDINKIGGFWTISMRTASDGWLVVLYNVLNESQDLLVPTLFHYDGTHWTEVHLPTIPNTRNLASVSTIETWTLNDITMVSATEGWAVGSHELQNPPSGYVALTAPVIFHYLNGTWSVASA